MCVIYLLSLSYKLTCAWYSWDFWCPLAFPECMPLSYLQVFQNLCCAKSLQSCPTLCSSIDCSQTRLSMEFSREEYWSGLPFPSPGDLPDPGTECMSPALTGGFFTTSANREATSYLDFLFCVSPSFSWDLHFSHLDGLFSSSSLLSVIIQHYYCWFCSYSDPSFSIGYLFWEEWEYF